jgi:hypothetical protein
MKPELTPLSSDQERRQPAHLGIDQHGGAALRHRADLAHRHGQHVGGEGDRLGVEIAARKRFVVEHDRIVGHRIGLDRRASRGVSRRSSARAHHLRLAAEAVGVLHLRAIVVAVADLAAVEQPASAAATRSARLAARSLDARVERLGRCP